ncbi:MAG: MATE family efflux transporter [Erysipelotrichaceae bacterium]|nr:MATE family efflux transporter [Erysipelotrichaceae bacterium]
MSESNSNKMGTMPVGKLLLKMGLPAVISMLLQAMYNIVDSIYVSQLGQDALFAVGIAFPLQMLLLSVALGCGVGTNALVARRLGQKRQEHANETATTGLVMSVIHSIILLVVGLIITKPFLRMFTDSPTVLKMATDYMYIILVFNLGQQVQVVCERILQATGNMILPMMSLIISAGTNVILDPIMIFGYFGFPALGVAGAAIATVIGQWVGTIFIFIMLIKKDHDIKIEFKGFKFNKIVAKKVYRIGLPTMIMNAIGSVTTTSMNAILVGFSETAVNALSIYFKIQSFVFMPIFGMTQGGMPILSYNYGAKNKERYLHTARLMLRVAFIIMALGTLMMQFFPDQILGMFNPTDELLVVGRMCLRIISYSFVFAAISIVIINIFQSLGYGFRSMSMSVLRQLGFLIPSALLLAQLFGLNAVWFAYPIAEILVVVIYAPICIKAIKTKFD